MEGSADVSLQEDHGEDDGPEFDEALDPEFEKVFDVDRARRILNREEVLDDEWTGFADDEPAVTAAPPRALVGAGI